MQMPEVMDSSDELQTDVGSPMFKVKARLNYWKTESLLFGVGRRTRNGDIGGNE
jgi:hypothetical protein